VVSETIINASAQECTVIECSHIPSDKTSYEYMNIDIWLSIVKITDRPAYFQVPRSLSLIRRMTVVTLATLSPSITGTLLTSAHILPFVRL
jgi:hypothetical protein